MADPKVAVTRKRSNEEVHHLQAHARQRLRGTTNITSARFQSPAARTLSNHRSGFHWTANAKGRYEGDGLGLHRSHQVHNNS